VARVPHVGLHRGACRCGPPPIGRRKRKLFSSVCRRRGMRYYPSPLILPSVLIALLLGIWPPECAKAAPGSKRQTEPRPPAVEVTQLRPGTPVFLVSQSSKGAELKHLNVEVKNVGRYPAKGVSVFVEVSSGLMTQLRGASTLAPGQSSIYVLRSRLPVVQSGPVRVISSCANCRR